MMRRIRGSISHSTINAIVAQWRREVVIMNIGRNHHKLREAVWATMGTVGRQLRQFLIGGGGKAMGRRYWRGLRGIAGYWTLFGSSSGNSSRGRIITVFNCFFIRYIASCSLSIFRPLGKIQRIDKRAGA